MVRTCFCFAVLRFLAASVTPASDTDVSRRRLRRDRGRRIWSRNRFALVVAVSSDPSVDGPPRSGCPLGEYRACGGHCSLFDLGPRRLAERCTRCVRDGSSFADTVAPRIAVHHPRRCHPPDPVQIDMEAVRSPFSLAVQVAPREVGNRTRNRGARCLLVSPCHWCTHQRVLRRSKRCVLNARHGDRRRPSPS